MGPAAHNPWQPPLTTWHFPFNPCFSISASSDSLTCSLCAETQVVPMQTNKRWSFSFCSASSSAAIWLSSSVIMVKPLLYFPGRLGGFNFAHHLAVKRGDRGQPAGAQAARNHQRDFLVRRRLAGHEMGGRLRDPIQDLLAAFDIAGCAQANDAQVLALGFHGKEVIECGHP